MVYQAGAYPTFSSIKRSFLLPTGWDARPWPGYHQHYIRQYPFIHLGGERHCESKVVWQKHNIFLEFVLEDGKLVSDGMSTHKNPTSVNLKDGLPYFFPDKCEFASQRF